MSNQVAMTFEEAINFDKAFVTDRINECLSICRFQLNRGYFPDDLLPHLFDNSLKQALSWIETYCSKDGFSEDEIMDLEDACVLLRVQRLAQVRNAKNQFKQVSKSSPSTRLSVLRVLGQVSKAQSDSRPAHALSRHWLPAPAPTAGLLSNTRSIGGLGQ